MSDQNTITPIFFSCSIEKYVSSENLIPHHIISHFYEGEMSVTDNTTIDILKPGDTTFCTKNSLLRFTKNASIEKPVKTVVIFLSQEFLQQYYAKHKPELNKTGYEKRFLLKPNALWSNYFNSLKPYIDLQEQLPAELTEIKQLEALSILRTLNKGIDSILSDFDAPGKIDLAAFMQKNYAFNLSIERFAYLTGRSISTFKRDFQKIFFSTPQRWLTAKRLELAHYLIEKKKLKPSDVYIESGFENFSHFSYAFKKNYGYNPSQLI